MQSGKIVKKKALYWTQQKNHRQPFQSLTTSLSTAEITTTKQAVETTIATSVAETTMPLEEEPKPVLFILPSDVKPEEVQDLLFKTCYSILLMRTM